MPTAQATADVTDRGEIERRFALNLVRAAKDPKSIKLRRKLDGWKTDYLGQLLRQPVE